MAKERQKREGRGRMPPEVQPEAPPPEPQGPEAGPELERPDAGPELDPVTVEGLTLDPENRRRRTARGARMLVAALGQVGAARSIVIDEHNEVIAGNGVVEAAAEAGITKLKIVDADGATIVAVRRRGLSPEDKRALAIFDNRTAELAEWDPEQLAADRAQGWPLSPWFDENEIRKHLRNVNPADPVVKEVPTDEVGDRFWIAIRGPLQSQAVALQRLREMMKDLEGVEVELGTVQNAEAWTG